MKKNKLYSIISLVVIFFIVLFLMRRETKKGKRKNKQNNSIEQFYTRDDTIHSVEYFRVKVFVELFNEISNKFEDLEEKFEITIDYTGSSNYISTAAQDGNLHLSEDKKILRCMLDIYTYLKYKETNNDILQIPLYRFFFDTIDNIQIQKFIVVTDKLTMVNYKNFIEKSFEEILDDDNFTMGVLQQLEFYLSRAITIKDNNDNNDNNDIYEICNFITKSKFYNNTNSIYNFNYKDLNTLIVHENGGHLTNNVPKDIKDVCYDSKNTRKRDYPVYKYLMYQMHIYKNNDDGKYFKYNWSEDITEAYKDSLSIYESMYKKIYNKYLFESNPPTFTDIYNILKEDLADLYDSKFDEEIEILKKRFDGLTDIISTTQSQAIAAPTDYSNCMTGYLNPGSGTISASLDWDTGDVCDDTTIKCYKETTPSEAKAQCNKYKDCVGFTYNNKNNKAVLKKLWNANVSEDNNYSSYIKKPNEDLEDLKYTSCSAADTDEAATAADAAEAAVALIEKDEAAAAENFKLQKLIAQQNYIENIENKYQEIENKLVDLKNIYIYDFEDDEEYENKLTEYKKNTNFASNYNNIKQQYDTRETDASNIINRTYLETEPEYNVYGEKVCTKDSGVMSMPIIEQIKCNFNDKELNYNTFYNSIVTTDIINITKKFNDAQITNMQQNRKKIINGIIVNKIQTPVTIYGNLTGFFKEGRLDIGKFETINT